MKSALAAGAFDSLRLDALPDHEALRRVYVVGIDEVYPHCPKSFLRGSVWKPYQWLPADAQPTSAEVTRPSCGGRS